MRKISILSGVLIIIMLSMLIIYLLTVDCAGQTVTVNVEPIPEEKILEQVEVEITDKAKYLVEYEKLLEHRECSTEWYKKYKDIISRNRGYIEYVDLDDVFTDEEVVLLCRTIETECFGGKFESKVNVANVILNRIDDERFSDDVTTIITQPNQFCYSKKEISEETKLALEYAYYFDDTTNGAVYFKKGYSNRWNGEDLKMKDQYNGHHFY